MRLERKEQNQKLKAAAKQALDVVTSAAHKTGRPCTSDCRRNCDKCGSTTCTCMCKRDCRFISTILSSDPEQFPLEERIAPLVFEINKLGIFRPNWSCEGHVGLDGKIWKIPRVWFYAESVLHVRLLADSISKMSIEKKLKCPWQVVLTFTDNDNLDTTFSVEPIFEEAKKLSYKQLSDDIYALAENVGAMVSARAQELSRLT
jgi:hypothetical protein